MQPALYDETVDTNPATINNGLNWAFMGDSQTHGRAYETPAVVSSPQAVETIWGQSQIWSQLLKIVNQKLF